MALDTASGGVLDEDVCERLMWQMLVEAESVTPTERLRALGNPELLDVADAVLVERLDRKFAERRRINEALVGGRLASIQASFERTVGHYRALLEAAQLARRQERYIRMLEGRIRNLGRQHMERVHVIEQGRVLGRSFSAKGAGILHVTGQAVS